MILLKIELSHAGYDLRCILANDVWTNSSKLYRRCLEDSDVQERCFRLAALWNKMNESYSLRLHFFFSSLNNYIERRARFCCRILQGSCCNIITISPFLSRPATHQTNLQRNPIQTHYQINSPQPPFNPIPTSSESTRFFINDK